MKFLSKIALIAALALTASFAAQTVYAAENNTTTKQEIKDYTENAMRKLGRGVCNVAFGALEIPISIYTTQTEEGGLAALTGGVFEGVAFFIGRELTGVAEILTFYTKLPGCAEYGLTGWGWGPIMEPEWVVSPAVDIFNIVYPETPVLR